MIKTFVTRNASNKQKFDVVQVCTFTNEVKPVLQCVDFEFASTYAEELQVDEPQVDQA